MTLSAPAPSPTTVDYPVGASVWHEVHVTSADGLAAYYAAVLGWRLDEETGVFFLDGAPIASIRVVPEIDATAIGWRVYLGVDDLEDAVARAVAAGAVVTEESSAIAVEGATATLLADPFGAPFGLAVLPRGTASVPSAAIGRLAGVDAMNWDIDANLAFHDALVDAPRTLEEAKTWAYRADGSVLHLANEISEADRSFLPPHWLPWFSVASQAEAAVASVAVGGGVNTQDQPIKYGSWGVVTDPAGSAFKALQVDVDQL